jgi:hypothetical protein
VERLLADPDRRRALVENARERVRDSYALEAHVGRVLDVYARVLGPRANGAIVTSSKLGRSFL